MIDIILQLLIFFILTSAFVTQQPGVKVHLPKAVTADVSHKETTVISIAKDNQLYFGSRLVTLNELRTQLVPHGKKNDPVLIRSDRQTSLGRVVEVWDLCRTLGIQQVNIATSTSSS